MATCGDWLRRSLAAALLAGVAGPSVGLAGTPAVHLGAPQAMYDPAVVAAGPFPSPAPGVGEQPAITQAAWLGQAPAATPLIPEVPVHIPETPVSPDLPPPIGGDVFHLSSLPENADPHGPRHPGWCDDLSLFLGLDGSKAPEDLGVNANFGLRGAFNWELPIWENRGLGVQVGSAVNYANNALPVLKAVNGTTDRVQSFTTVGLFQRTDFGLNWGVGYDFLAEDYYRSLTFGQWRGQIGHQIGPDNEVGIWTAIRSFGDNARVAGQSFRLKPITQGNLFWRHVWGNESVTRLWVGLAEEHGRFLLGAPARATAHHPFTFGADLYVPLTDHFALFGEANFITPNDTGTVTATLGVAFYPGGRAKSAGRSRFAPLLPVANNTTFAIDVQP